MTRFAVAPVVVRLLGSTFAATTDSATTLAHIRRLWAPFLLDADDAARAVGESRATPVALAGSTDSARLAQFAVTVNAATLDAAPHFAVHAAVIAHGGHVIAIPGTSGIGKSTLAAACLRTGFSYVSDEALCLREPDGAVVPYPRPVALSRWSARAVQAPSPGVEADDELLFTPDDLGSRRAGQPLWLQHVVLVERKPTGAPQLRRAQRHGAITRLLELSFNHYRRPAHAVQLAAAVVADAQVWALEYSDPMGASELMWSALIEPRAAR